MAQAFAPGCALMIYKPELGKRLLEFLNRGPEPIPEHLTCCHHEPGLPAGTRIINTCPGCDRRYRELYPGVSTISLWELLAESDSFPFPDYHGVEMTVLDACPTRTETRVHDAVRALLARMNITVVEPANTRTRGTCCGDSFHGTLPVEEVKAQMRKRGAEMPRHDVVVYCVSCTKAMHIGGRRPHYLVDLLFGEETTIGTFEPDEWHRQVDEFIEAH
ncbi:MAG: (Fe-S)-binding protein [Holophaga sp.]|jgi:Fe-S oxidoreductase